MFFTVALRTGTSSASLIIHNPVDNRGFDLEPATNKCTALKLLYTKGTAGVTRREGPCSEARFGPRPRTAYTESLEGIASLCPDVALDQPRLGGVQHPVDAADDGDGVRLRLLHGRSVLY